MPDIIDQGPHSGAGDGDGATPDGPEHTLDAFGWTARQRAAVLDGLRTERNMRLACENTGLSVAGLRRRQKDDPEFAQDCAAVRDEYLDELEQATKRDAADGFKLKRTTRRKGESGEMEVVEEVEQEHIDNTLRIAVLARLRPDTWGRKDNALKIPTGRRAQRLIVELDDEPETEPETQQP